MANTLTALAPTLFSSARVVANEPFGVVAAIDIRFDDKGVSKGDTVTVPVAPTRTASDFTPANVASSGTDAIASSVGVQITKSRKVDWKLTGEEQRSLDNGNVSMDWVQQLIASGMRTLRNECEADAALAVKQGASRAFGTAGTTPFASDLSALTQARKILQDNGAPLADLQLCIDSSAGLNLRNLGVVQNANTAGSDSERRTGDLMPQFGFNIRESAGVVNHTKGTGTSYLLNGALTVGDTDLVLDTGSGTIIPGDIVTIAGDTTKYVSNGTLASNTVNIGAPGLRFAGADNAALTVGNDYSPNMAFERNAVVGIVRPPLMPANSSIQQIPISDQYGMTYLLLDISQYGQRSWELHLAWGFKAINPEFIALILG